MKKKVLTSLVLIVSLVFTTTFCFAVNENMQNAGENAKDALNSTGNAIKDATQGTGEMLKDGANAVKNGVQNVGEGIKDGVENTGNAIKDGAENMNNDMNNNDGNDNGTVQNVNDRNTNDTNYDATRTAAEGNFMGMDNGTWSWLIVGIAAVAIIALIWYYTSQTNRRNYRHRDE